MDDQQTKNEPRRLCAFHLDPCIGQIMQAARLIIVQEIRRQTGTDPQDHQIGTARAIAVAVVAVRAVGPALESGAEPHSLAHVINAAEHSENERIREELSAKDAAADAVRASRVSTNGN